MIAALAADDAGEPRTRFLLSQALSVGEAIVEGLRPHATRVELAGSARRMVDACKDLDVVAATADPERAGQGLRGAAPRSTWCTPRASPARAP